MKQKKVSKRFPIEEQKSKWGWLVMGGLAVVFLVLAYKNPFEERSLVANLEPYPDTLYYSVPAWNWINGGGFKMATNGVEIKKLVPPGYGWYLIPFLAMFRDIRAFYFGNILLGLVSVFFLVKILERIFGKDGGKWYGVGVVGFLYVTAEYIYYLSQLVMAENITLAAVMAGMWLIGEERTRAKEMALAGLVFGLVMIKASNLPLAMVLAAGTIWPMWRERKFKKIMAVLAGWLTLGYIFFLRGEGFLKNQPNMNPEIGFSPVYFAKNFRYYWGVITGEEGRFLWLNGRIIDRGVACLGLAGLVLGLVWEKRLRGQCGWGLVLVGAGVGFMSFFYYADSRYVVALVVPILTGFGVLGKMAADKLGRGAWLMGVLVMAAYLMGKTTLGERKIVQLKKQVGLNWRYREDPWNYLAVKNFNQYFENKDGEKYLATFLPPFYVELFSNHKYGYLPISRYQEFATGAKDALGKMGVYPVAEKYRELLAGGKEVYISNYYINNDLTRWGQDWKEITDEFRLEEVSEGCLGSCRIYRVREK